jgi:hypothetical protein
VLADVATALALDTEGNESWWTGSVVKATHKNALTTVERGGGG